MCGTAGLVLFVVGLAGPLSSGGRYAHTVTWYCPTASWCVGSRLSQVVSSRADLASVRDVSSLPLVPTNPLPWRQRLAAVRTFHTGMDKLRDAGGPVTLVRLGPRWM